MKKYIIIMIVVLLPVTAYAVTAIMTAFDKGELSPRAYGRTDIRAFYSGARTLENMFTRPLGPVQKRPGTYYIADAAGEARLIGFQKTASDGLVLEFSDQSIRVFSGG